MVAEEPQAPPVPAGPPPAVSPVDPLHVASDLGGTDAEAGGGDRALTEPLAPSAAAAGTAAAGSAAAVGAGPESSIDRRYREERTAAKVRHWREADLAAGLVELTWRDELDKRRGDGRGPNRGPCAELCSDDQEPMCGCLYLSGILCSRLGAGRVGNMAVLRESAVLVEEEVSATADDDDDGGGGGGGGGDEEQAKAGTVLRTRTVRRRKLDLVVGPYWPMLFCVTYPLILSVSLWTLVSAILKPDTNVFVALLWGACTSGLLYSLFGVSCRDPGIQQRYRTVPAWASADGRGRDEWRWNDQAQTFRPRGAMYDSDCGVVIEQFDHTW